MKRFLILAGPYILWYALIILYMGLFWMVSQSFPENPFTYIFGITIGMIYGYNITNGCINMSLYLLRKYPEI